MTLFKQHFTFTLFTSDRVGCLKLTPRGRGKMEACCVALVSAACPLQQKQSNTISHFKVEMGCCGLLLHSATQNIHLKVEMGCHGLLFHSATQQIHFKVEMRILLNQKLFCPLLDLRLLDIAKRKDHIYLMQCMHCMYGWDVIHFL